MAMKRRLEKLEAQARPANPSPLEIILTMPSEEPGMVVRRRAGQQETITREQAERERLPDARIVQPEAM